MEKKELYIQLGKRITDIRTAAGLSIEALAEKVGIRSVTLVNIEKGSFDIKYTILFAIAEALDMRIDFFPKN